MRNTPSFMLFSVSRIKNGCCVTSKVMPNVLEFACLVLYSNKYLFNKESSLFIEASLCLLSVTAYQWLEKFQITGHRLLYFINPKYWIKCVTPVISRNIHVNSHPRNHLQNVFQVKW